MHLSVSSCVPLGIFCSSLKMGLFLMSCLALKKCMAGGKLSFSSSSCFIFSRRASSRRSASVSDSCPPVCMEASSFIRASLCLGSGTDRPPVKKSSSKQSTAAWGRCNRAAIAWKAGGSWL